jgi:hypothetical protein
MLTAQAQDHFNSEVADVLAAYSYADLRELSYDYKWECEKRGVRISGGFSQWLRNRAYDTVTSNYPNYW